MLLRVVIKNFRGLRSVDVPLKPLTVLIGPNDTGKTAFLVALRNLSSGQGAPLADYWQHQKETPLAIQAEMLGGSRLNYPRPVADLPWQGAMFRLPASQGVALQSHGYTEFQGPPPLSESAPEVPTLVDYLLRRDRGRFFGFVEAAKRLVPGLQDIEVATPDPSERRLDLVIENGLRVTGENVSSGVRLLLFFLALAYHPKPADTWLLEEPENGIHPKRLADVMSLLREITGGLHAGRAAQVILTTHSPYLLDCVDLATDQVLVFRREEDGARSAQPADAERLKTFMDEFMLGEVWFNQGEPGLVAKKG